MSPSNTTVFVRRSDLRLIGELNAKRLNESAFAAYGWKSDLYDGDILDDEVAGIEFGEGERWMTVTLGVLIHARQSRSYNAL